MPVTNTSALPGAGYRGIKLVKRSADIKQWMGCTDTNLFPTINSCNTTKQTHANKTQNTEKQQLLLCDISTLFFCDDKRNALVMQFK